MVEVPLGITIQTYAEKMRSQRSGQGVLIYRWVNRTNLFCGPPLFTFTQKYAEADIQRKRICCVFRITFVDVGKLQAAFYGCVRVYEIGEPQAHVVVGGI